MKKSFEKAFNIYIPLYHYSVFTVKEGARLKVFFRSVNLEMVFSHRFPPKKTNKWILLYYYSLSHLFLRLFVLKFQPFYSLKFQALEGLKISSIRRVEIKRKSRWFRLKSYFPNWIHFLRVGSLRNVNS